MSELKAPNEALRHALIERWFDTDEEDHHETATDEQILARIEDLVGEGWYHAGKEAERAERLKEALRLMLQYGIDEDDQVWIASNPAGVGRAADVLGIDARFIRNEVQA